MVGGVILEPNQLLSCYLSCSQPNSGSYNTGCFYGNCSWADFLPNSSSVADLVLDRYSSSSQLCAPADQFQLCSTSYISIVLNTSPRYGTPYSSLQKDLGQVCGVIYGLPHYYLYFLPLLSSHTETKLGSITPNTHDKPYFHPEARTELCTAYNRVRNVS